MAESYRHYRARRAKKPKRRGKAALVALLITALVAAAVAVFAVNCYGDTAEKLKRMSYPREFSGSVEQAAREYDLDPALIYAVCRTESGFDPNAQSAVGARGVMQMMPETFEWLMQKRGESGEYTADDLFDPAVCIDYGSYLLRVFFDTYGDERCAVAAYNAGFVVGDWLNDPNCSPDGKTLANIPYPETARYTEKVEDAKQVYRELYYS